MQPLLNHWAKRTPAELVDILRFWTSVIIYVALPFPNFQAPKIVISLDTSAQGWGAKAMWTSRSLNHYTGPWTRDLSHHTP